MPDQSQTDPRIYFAAERTLLAWIRTGLAMMGFGFVVARFGLFLREMQAARPELVQPPTYLSQWFGIVLVGVGVSVNVWAAIQHVRLTHRLQAGTWRPQPAWGGIAAAVVLACGGAAVALFLLFTR